MSGRSDVEVEIRKLRKKLRQIEHLERLEFEDRELTEDEELKISRKVAVRSRLQELLLEFSEELELSVSSEQNVSAGSVSTGDDSFMCDTGFHEEPSDTVANIRNITGRQTYEPFVTMETKQDSLTPDVVKVPEPAQDSEGWSRVTKTTSSGRGSSMAATVGKVEEPMVESAKKPKPREKTKGERPKVSREENPLTELRREWAKMKFHVLTLEGHNDLVCAVHVSKRCLLSGSRDTMLKVWDVQTGQEQRSLGSHTGTVTAVYLLSPVASKPLCDVYQLASDDYIILSASQDCTLKVWSLNTGKMVRSIYTYNPVTALSFVDTPGLIVAGSGGGKVELWNAETGQCLQSLKAHEDSITALQVDGSFVYSTAADGVVKVYQLRNLELHLIHSSDDVNIVAQSALVRRHIRSMATANQKVYFGDDGMNVKVLDWRKGSIHKLRNHAGEFGSTDAMCCHENILLTSGYDLDSGLGYINVRSLPDEKYVATLEDENTSRIMCMSCERLPSNHLVVATGGFDLQLWIQKDRHGLDTADTVRPGFLPTYDRAARHSDIESDNDMSESEPETTGLRYWQSPARRPRESIQPDAVPTGWLSWCTVL